ncbi:MAG: 1-deoxy-D-xylulose-5-phosphate synthase [Actinomycetales bacterium]|nr:1-deoxy-D-xylulose-5-phosphate synthase [Actinomycetales bacterium]
MAILERITRPRDLRGLVTVELVQLAEEIREFLVANVARTGGHLGPNLGVVELTIAIHRVFDSPRDRIVFDTGHQAYVHKLLTGRHDFSQLRQNGGLSGYPSRQESVHDVVENSHASTALSWGDGIARANLLRGRSDRHVVVVVGDGALTGGMAWEALNNIAEGPDRNLVIVVNDNGRSYAPTTGGIAHHLDALRTTHGYEKALDWGKRTLLRGGTPGRMTYEALHGLKKGMKDVLAPQGLFEDLGIKYIGPVDGHDVVAMEFALTRARAYEAPVIVHAITEKGRGYQPALDDVADRFHAVGIIHPETGLPVVPARFGWTSVFSQEILKIARQRDDVVAITAAMLQPVGLGPMSEEFPDRVIDVGIAEQHAVTSAAGLAFAGLHPVVAVYATFLNRGYDQVLMDVGLHNQAVTLVLDRAGVTGDDGPSHHGMWDIALLRTVPNLRLAAPRDEDTLRRALREAVAIDGPTAVRYPKGPLPDPIPALDTIAGLDVIGRHPGERNVLVVGVGAMAGRAIEVGRALDAQGIGSLVIDPRWVLPVSPALVDLAAHYELVVHIEDGLVEGGAGSALRDALAAAGARVPVQAHGVPRGFHHHAKREELLDEFHLRPADVARQVAGALLAPDVARLDEAAGLLALEEPES